jgi:hypothetical protein
MTMRGGGRGGGRRRGALRGRARALLRRRLAGGLLLTAAVGGPVALDPIDTSGSGSTAITLTNVGALSLSTAGAGATSSTLRKVGVLAPTTAGAGSSAVARTMVGVLAPATTGRANLAIVLTELGSLSPLTSGRSSLAAQLNKVGVLAPATAGASTTQETLGAARTFSLGYAGASTWTLTLLGAHGLLTIDTTGVGVFEVAITDASTIAPPLIGDSIVAADGSIWSHAATLGTRFKGSEFTIDQATIENFVRVFTSGYPRRCPSTTSTARRTARRRLGSRCRRRATCSSCAACSPTAGLHRRAARGGREARGQGRPRSLDDPKNLGLWMRWKPTTRALGMIQEGEYSELSIAFGHDVPNNVDGKSQGPALLAVALTNLPLPRRHALRGRIPRPRRFPGRTGKAGEHHEHEDHDARGRGGPVREADGRRGPGVAEITALQTELPQLRSWRPTSAPRSARPTARRSARR